MNVHAQIDRDSKKRSRRIRPGLRAVSLAAAVAAVMSIPSVAHAAQVTSASLAADPATYTGACPARITFNGTITVDGPVMVQYTFLRSDGARGPVETLRFASAGTQPVSTTWDLGGPDLPSYSGWQAIRVLYPNDLESNQAHFTVSCGTAGGSVRRYRFQSDRGAGEITLRDTGRRITAPPLGTVIEVTLLYDGARLDGVGVLQDPDASGRSLISFSLLHPRGERYHYTGSVRSDGHAEGSYYGDAYPAAFSWWTFSP